MLDHKIALFEGKRFRIEGSEVYEKIVQLEMIAADGKYYQTDVADTEGILRIIQGIPSPKEYTLSAKDNGIGGIRKEIKAKVLHFMLPFLCQA